MKRTLSTLMILIILSVVLPVKAATVRSETESTFYLPMIMKWARIYGFDSQFWGTTGLWEGVSGTGSVDSEYFTLSYINPPSCLIGGRESAYYPTVYSDFDYQARMKASGAQFTASLMTRGIVDPLGTDSRGAYGVWHQYYAFQYNINGEISVFKRLAGGPETALLDWTASSAVNPTDWNTLRVIADGSALNYYVNGSLAWSGSDDSLTEGVVGFGIDAFCVNTLLVDWATLSFP